MADTMPDTERIEIHPPKVGMYRAAAFLDLGFDVEQAAKLANTRVDLTQVRKAVRQGCTTEMAWQIWGAE